MGSIIMEKFLPFALPEFGEEEIRELGSVIRSGWVTTGPKTHQLELEFAAYLGGDLETVAVNSATSGLHIGLEALGIGPGDEVITTTFTFTATAEVIRYLGADPVFVDIDSDTLCIDVHAVERSITSRTKAVIPVHFGGHPADMKRVQKMATYHDLKVIEDAAHALPTTYERELIGTLASDVTIFSFYANKTMTTGEGGMLVTRNKEIAKRARLMRLHGIDRNAFDRFTAEVPKWHYDVIAPGFKYNMTDIAAAIGIHQLRKLDKFQGRRQEIAEIYNKEFKHLPITLPPNTSQGNVHSWHLYVIQITDDAPVTRDQFIERMFELGVGCSVHYIPLHLHSYWRVTYRLEAAMFPNSQRVYERCVSLPIYSRMTLADVEKVVSCVKKVLKKGNGRGGN